MAFTDENYGGMLIEKEKDSFGCKDYRKESSAEKLNGISVEVGEGKKKREKKKEKRKPKQMNGKKRSDAWKGIFLSCFAVIGVSAMPGFFANSLFEWIASSLIFVLGVIIFVITITSLKKANTIKLNILYLFGLWALSTIVIGVVDLLNNPINFEYRDWIVVMFLQLVIFLVYYCEWIRFEYDCVIDAYEGENGKLRRNNSEMAQEIRDFEESIEGYKKLVEAYKKLDIEYTKRIEKCEETIEKYKELVETYKKLDIEYKKRIETYEETIEKYKELVETYEKIQNNQELMESILSGNE